MKKTLTKRVVSLLAVVALLMTMFTGMIFNVSANDDAAETTTVTYTMQDNSNLSYDKDGTNKEVFTIANFSRDGVVSSSKACSNHTYGGTVYSDATEYPHGKIVVMNRNQWKNNTSTSVGQLGLLTTNTTMDLSKGFSFKVLGLAIEASDKNGLNQTGFDIKVGSYTISLKTFVSSGNGSVTFMRNGEVIDTIALTKSDYNFNNVKFADRTGVVKENVIVDTDSSGNAVENGSTVSNPFFISTYGLYEPSIVYDAEAKTLTLALDGAENIRTAAPPATKECVLNNVEPDEFKSVSASVTGGILNGLVALYEAELEVVKSADQEEVTFTEADVIARHSLAQALTSVKDPSVTHYIFNDKDVAEYADLFTYSAEKLATVDATKGFSFATPIIFNQNDYTNNGYKVDFGTFYVEVSCPEDKKFTLTVCKADGTVISTRTIDTGNYFVTGNLMKIGVDHANITNNTSSQMTSSSALFNLGITGDADGNITVFGGVPFTKNSYSFTANYNQSEVIATFNAATEGVAEYTTPAVKVKTQGSGVYLPTPELSVALADVVDDTSSEDVSSDATSSEDVSSEEVSSEEVSSEEVSSDATSSEDVSSDDTSSETVVETVTNLLPTTDATKWTGDTTYIAENDVVLGGATYAPAGGFVVNANTNSLKKMTTVDTYDLGNKFKISGTLVAYSYHPGEYYIQAYAQAGDFKFEISEGLNKEGVRTLYAKAYMGEEVVHEKSWPQSGNTHIFRQVRFNATIDNTAKTVALDYTTGWLSSPVTNTGTGTYTGDYSFDGIKYTAAAKNCFLNGSTIVNVAVGKLSFTTYEVQKPVEVTVTVNAKNGREYSYVANSYPTIEGMLAADATIKAAIQDVPGYNLTGWTTVDGTAVETKVAFTEDVTLVPVYTKAAATYAVVIDGVVNNYAFNTYVTAVSNLDDFSNWKENEVTVSYAKEYSFFVGCARNLVSVSGGNDPAPVQPVILANAWTDGTYDYVLTEWALPEGCTLVAEGVIMTKDASVDLTAKTLADVDGTTIRSSSTRLTTAAGQYLVYTNTNANFEAKAYLTYSDGTNQYTIYTDAVTVA